MSSSLIPAFTQIRLSGSFLSVSGDNRLKLGSDAVMYVRDSGAFTSSAILQTTGSTLYNIITALSGADNLNIANTGQMLYNDIIGLSGIVNNINSAENLFYRTGSQSLTGNLSVVGQLIFNSGLQTPTQYFGATNYTLTAQNYIVIATGSPLNVTGIIPSPNNSSGTLFTLINNTTGPLQISGVIGVDTNPIINQYDTLEIYAASGVWNYIRQTGSPLVSTFINFSGYVGNISGALNIIIANTGQQAWTAAQNNGINLSGNLGTTGSNLYNDIIGLSGLLPQYITTGSTLSFTTGIPTGVDVFYVNYLNYTFAAIPKIQITFELTSPNNIGYYFAVSGRSTTGFFAIASDTILETGNFLDVFVKL